MIGCTQPTQRVQSPLEADELVVFFQRVRNFMALDAILSCLGTKGYAINDEWVMGAATMQDWQVFLHHFQSTMDTEAGSMVTVNDLEAISKKRDETACELVAHI